MHRVFITFKMRQLLLLLSAFVFVASATGLRADDKSDNKNVQTFKALKGWWLGSGRLGFKNGETEEVKCRATYRLEETDGAQMRQALRCASASGAVEIESNVRQDGKLLSGTWAEKKYELSGQIAGQFVPGGLRVNVSGRNLKADMTINVREDRHVVEIQFFESSLFGLSLIFSRSKKNPEKTDVRSPTGI